TTTRKPFLSSSFFATSAAANNRSPNSSRSLALASSKRGSTRFGTIRTWTGACGLTSRNATKFSFSSTISAGISRAMIFSKIVTPLTKRTVEFGQIFYHRNFFANETYDLCAQTIAGARPDARAAQLLHARIEGDKLH